MPGYCVLCSVAAVLVPAAFWADGVRYRFFVNRRLRRSGFQIKPGSWTGFINGPGLIGVVHCERRGRSYVVWVTTRRCFFPASVVLKLERDPDE